MSIEERLAKLEALVETTVRTLGLLQDRFDDHQEEEERRSDIITARLEREDDKLSSNIYRLENQVARIEGDVNSISRQVDNLRYYARS